jgi:hypothetical protein
LLKSNNLVHYWAGHERPAYLGWGLILAIVSLLSIKFWYVRTAVVDDFKKRYWPALLLLGSTVAVLSFGKDWGYWGMVLVMFAMAQFLFFLSAHIRYRDWSVPIGFLLLCLLPIYGMADGPRGGANPVDVSVWGVFQNLVPGVSKMRAMGRMAPLGLIVLFALTFYGYFALVSAIAKRRKLLVFNCFFLTMLSFAIWEHTSAVYIFKYQEESIRPSPSAEVFFSNKSYKILSLPLHPWHVTTYAMNYFVESPEILLMNGYSGKMNELLKQLMDKESVGFMNLDTFSLAKENQAELVVVFKELLNDKQSQKLESLSPIIQFQDDKIAAIDINALLENEQAFGVGEK